MKCTFLLVALKLLIVNANNLQYLDPTKLQTVIPPSEQKTAAEYVIWKYVREVEVDIDPSLFTDNKDTFHIETEDRKITVRASSGVAAVWGFYYYVKNYCKSHISWQGIRQTESVDFPFPRVNITIVANDRFRFYQNVCTVSYSFVWWNEKDWRDHVDWMALNGINMALVPVAQEAAWARVYRQLGLTDEEINDHFTGPAFLSWLRMGNVHGWGGPLPNSWHARQQDLQKNITDYMLKLGIIPVLPAFNGHVPTGFNRLYPNASYHSVEQWNSFNRNYCCDLFLDPEDPLFRKVGKMFLAEVTKEATTGHIYTSDPFNEIGVSPWSTNFVKKTAEAIYTTMSEFDGKAVWLLQNWMFVNAPDRWPKNTVREFLTAAPLGRILVLDLQSEQWPQYDLYDMYYGQPFIWSMLHNFGGTLGMFGNMVTINRDVYEARSRVNSTMIGIGLTPEGINQNYVVYELMLESAWRKNPIQDLETWLGDYAERRYGCDHMRQAWKYLLRSVYSFNGLNRVRGKYVITRRPSFKIKPWAWYHSKDLFEAFRIFSQFSHERHICKLGYGFNYDLADVTRQAMQYRAEQLYTRVVTNRFANSWTFNASINEYLDVMNDMSQILASSEYFRGSKVWFDKALSYDQDGENGYLYEMNARNQITLWGPNGEISDYACKQWVEPFVYYYMPRWRAFLASALDAKVKGEMFDEKGTQDIIRATVEKAFLSAELYIGPVGTTREIAKDLYVKWAVVPGLIDLPITVITRDANMETTFADVDSESDEQHEMVPSVTMLRSTTPL